MTQYNTSSFLSLFIALVKRDVRLAWVQGGASTMVLAFFLIAVNLFPFAIGPEPQMLGRIAPGVLWVMALFACLLSLDRLYQADYDDGALDDLVISPLPLLGVVLAKTVAHWFATLLPLVVIAPVMGLMLNLPDYSYGILVGSLLIGTPALSFIGSIGAALTVSVRRAGVLMGLLVLPLYIPTLVFGVSAIDAASMGTDPFPHLALLGAVTLVTGVVSPFASAAAVRLSIE